MFWGIGDSFVASLANSNRRNWKITVKTKSSGCVKKPVEKSTNILEKSIWHRKCQPGPKVCKNSYTRIAQICGEVQKINFVILGEFWSFSHVKIYLWYQTQKKSGSWNTFSLLRPTVSHQIWSRSNENQKVLPMIQKISDKCLKIEVTKSAIKHFEKFQLFVIGCVFALFQCCITKFSIGSNFGVKPKKSLYSNCLFCTNLLFCWNIVFPQP